MSRTLKARLITNSALASVWASNNPVLLRGEIGIEIDTKKFKFGDGTSAWNQLDYASSQGFVIEDSPPTVSDVLDIGTLWLNTANDAYYYLASVVDNNATWKQIITPDDLSDLGMGDMLKAVFATNDKVNQGYVDKAITADSTPKLATSRTISITGDGTGSASFDGTANAPITLTLKNSGVTAGTHTKVTVDSKGIVTSGAALVADDIPNIPNTKVTGLGTASTKNVGTAQGNVPELGSGGKLDESVLPAIAIIDTFTVESQTEMLALDVQKGDIAIRTDLNKTFILSRTPATELANWLELRTPTDLVLSVNGKIGAVTLSKSDVGLGNVDNTSDANKPISSATQAALDAITSSLGSYLLKTADPNVVYGTDVNGNGVLLPYSNNSANNSILRVDGTGQLSVVKIQELTVGEIKSLSGDTIPVNAKLSVPSAPTAADELTRKDYVDTQVNTRVEKVAGMGLSQNSFTTAEKNKLAGIDAGAQVNTVTSVAGKVGVITLATSDLTDGSSILFDTDTLILDGNTLN